MDFTSFKFPRAATEAEVEARKQCTLTVLEAERPSGQTSRGPGSGRAAFGALPVDLVRYLEMIRDAPGLPATERDKLYAIPLKKGNHMRSLLRNAGFIEEVQVNPGIHGKNFKEVRLTEQGQELLRRSGNEEENRGKERSG